MRGTLGKHRPHGLFPVRGFCPRWKKPSSTQQTSHPEAEELQGPIFFLFVSTFLFHFTNIYYVISLRLEVYQYTDCTFLCIYKAQHYRTLQTHLIQTFLYVAPFVHKCPQKYYKHEINPMSSCMTELVEPH